MTVPLNYQRQRRLGRRCEALRCSLQSSLSSVSSSFHLHSCCTTPHITLLYIAYDQSFVRVFDPQSHSLSLYLHLQAELKAAKTKVKKAKEELDEDYGEVESIGIDALARHVYLVSFVCCLCHFIFPPCFFLLAHYYRHIYISGRPST